MRSYAASFTSSTIVLFGFFCGFVGCIGQGVGANTKYMAKCRLKFVQPRGSRARIPGFGLFPELFHWDIFRWLGRFVLAAFVESD